MDIYHTYRIIGVTTLGKLFSGYALDKFLWAVYTHNPVCTVGILHVHVCVSYTTLTRDVADLYAQLREGT